MKELENGDSLNYNQDYSTFSACRFKVYCRDVLHLIHKLHKYTSATTTASGNWSDIIGKS